MSLSLSWCLPTLAPKSHQGSVHKKTCEPTLNTEEANNILAQYYSLFLDQGLQLICLQTLSHLLSFLFFWRLEILFLHWRFCHHRHHLCARARAHTHTHTHTFLLEIASSAALLDKSQESSKILQRRRLKAEGLAWGWQKEASERPKGCSGRGWCGWCGWCGQADCGGDEEEEFNDNIMRGEKKGSDESISTKNLIIYL